MAHALVHVLFTGDDRRCGWVRDQAELAELGIRVVGLLHDGENFGWRDVPDDLARRLVLRNRLQTVTARAGNACRVACIRPWHHYGSGAEPYLTVGRPANPDTPRGEHR